MRASMYVIFSVSVTFLVSCSQKVIDHAEQTTQSENLELAEHISDNDMEYQSKSDSSEYSISNITMYIDELGRPTYLLFMQQEIGDNVYQDKVVTLHMIGDSLIEPEFINLSDTDSICIKGVDAEV